MPSALRRFIVAVTCLALVGAGVTLAVATDEGGSAGNAAETQYGQGQGCTPGFWKNHTGVEIWGTEYSPSDSFDEVFGVKLFGPSVSLLDAAKLGGGGFEALARHAVAALLNSSHVNVNYGLSTDQVIEMVQQAVKTGDPESTKNVFEALNESGCGIDAHGNPIGD